MIHGNIELHNVEEVVDLKGGGVGLRRIPESVRRHVNEACRYRMCLPASGEIRFVTDDGNAKVTLSVSPEAQDDEILAVIFYGDFQHGTPIYIRGRERRTLEIEPNPQLARLPKSVRESLIFSPDVIRIMLRGSPVAFHDVAGKGVRPPKPDELPSRRLLTYGTSITHGANASLPHLSYAAQLARRLRADLINLGSGGSAHCEPELADYIAARGDWNIATLALSVNMMGFSNDEFYERVAYMVKTVAAADTTRPVACITLYPYYGDWGLETEETHKKGTSADKRQALRDAVAAADQPNLHLIEGPNILVDIVGLTPDLIHPADNGMSQMGENLARQVERFLT